MYLPGTWHTPLRFFSTPPKSTKYLFISLKLGAQREMALEYETNTLLYNVFFERARYQRFENCYEDASLRRKNSSVRAGGRVHWILMSESFLMLQLLSTMKICINYANVWEAKEAAVTQIVAHIFQYTHSLVYFRIQILWIFVVVSQLLYYAALTETLRSLGWGICSKKLSQSNPINWELT